MTQDESQPQRESESERRGATPEIFRIIAEDLPDTTVRRIRIIHAVIGLAAVVAGATLLIIPGKTLQFLAVVLGIYFIVSGIIRAVTAIVSPALPAGWRVLDVMIGVLLTIGGIIFIENSAASAAMTVLFVTLMVGIGWILEGVMALVGSWSAPQSGWAIFAGVLSVVAGIIVLFMPMQSSIVIIIFTAISLLVLGAASLVRAFTFGRRR